MKIIYEDKYFQIYQKGISEQVPGFYMIKEKNGNWDDSIDSINRLAELEKIIRDTLLKQGVELVGIYREQMEQNFEIYIIPYHVDRLNMLGISPDLYQPYINKYLDSYKEDFDEEKTKYENEIVEQLKIKIKKEIV